MLKCISVQILINIYHVIQELWAFSLADHDLSETASIEKAVMHASS